MPVRRMLTLAALAAALTVADASRAGLIILGNLPAANGGFAATVSGGITMHIKQAVSFTMPALAYPVGHVSLLLSDYDTANGDVAALGIYLDNGSDLPGELVGNLFSNPSSDSTDYRKFDFTPLSPLTLAALTKYWLMVDASAGIFTWNGTNPMITPLSPIGAMVGRQVGFVNDMLLEIPANFSSFEIVSSVPEPATAWLILGWPLSYCVSRRCVRRKCRWSCISTSAKPVRMPKHQSGGRAERVRPPDESTRQLIECGT